MAAANRTATVRERPLSHAARSMTVATLCCLLVSAPISGQEACAQCHRQIYDSYRLTGMARSFSRITPTSAPEFSRNSAFYHQASEQHFSLNQRDGKFFERRWQIGPDGRESNVLEMQIDFVLGSGNHARTYLHRQAGGRLIELPVGWYSENGGSWGTNPGYDRADHMDFRRKIDQECLFCHNASSAEPGAIPEGIDCQRCHGPGQEHVQKARAGSSLDATRAAIVNPKRLAPERQLEVCLQCHLESTSRRLPYSVRRYGRDFFSYRPGQPLERYILHFDHAPGAGYDDKFEIDHAAYRLLKSACFLRSNGALTCTTCHNPHQVMARETYIRACLGCHSTAHRTSEDCVDCHMPKRRTDDVVHAVMTDHYIQRVKPARDLLAPLAEQHDTGKTAYRGEVALLYPRRLLAGEDELYLAAAQVIDAANLATGIPRLQKAIDTYRPAQAEFYFELANAYRETGQNQNAIRYYEEALKRKPEFPEARRNYAQALIHSDRAPDAVKILESAGQDADTLNALGEAYLNFAKPDRAAATLRRALRADPGIPEIHVNLANALSRLGDAAGAIESLRTAIRLAPSMAAAHNNLASLLNARGDFDQARYHFERAMHADPSSAVAHYNYGRALSERKLYAEAESHLSQALALDPQFADAAVALGLVFARNRQLGRAIESYRRAIAIKPALPAAHFNLALALLARGDKTEAKREFEIVIHSDPNDYEARLRLGKILLDEGRYDLAIISLQVASQSPKSEVRTAALDALRAAKSAK